MKLYKRRKLFYVLLISFIIILSFIIYSLFLSPKAQALIDVQVWDGVVSENFTSGSGAYNDPYIISDGGDLAYLFEQLNTDNYLSYYNGYYEIANNIDLNGYDFSYINSDNPFKGHINGNGYTIFNFKLEKTYQKENSYYISLFNDLDSAFISYLNIEDVTINVLENENFNEESQINISLLSQSMTNTNLNNISFHNINIDGIDIDNINGGLISISDKGNNDINNLNINLNSKYSVNQIFKNYKDYDETNAEIEETTIKNIIYSDEENSLIDDIELENTYHYTINDNDISFDNKTNDEVIDILNENGDDLLYWTIEGNKPVVTCLLVDEVEVPEEEEIEDEEVIPFTMIEESYDYEDTMEEVPSLMMVGSSAVTFDEEESGIRDNIVYVNDLDKDKNYYESLNYTEVRSNALPGSSSTGYYDEEYLVKSRIIYSSEDINNGLSGAVSPTESANTYIYYKYYPLERDINGNLLTDSNGNNYIKIELIDGPFSSRPTNKGFSGWSTSDSRVTLEFDKDTYTRYALVSVGDTRTIDITFNAIWEKANIITGGSSSISGFDDYGMKVMYTTEQVTETTESDYPCNYRFNQDVTTISTSYTNRVRNGNNLPANVYYTKNNSGTVNAGSALYYSGSSGTTCQVTSGSGTKRCYYFEPSTISSGTAYDSSTTYRIITSSGSNYTITNDASSYLTNDICTGEVTTTHDRNVSLFNDGDSAVGYFYYVGTSYSSNNNLYYDSVGRSCSSSSNSCSSGAYKLIQYNDSLNNSDGSSISIINEEDGDVVDLDNYYYLVTRDMNILVNNTSGTNLSSYMSSKPYTLTTTYNGDSINNNYVTLSSSSSTVSLSNDMVIENIRVQGYGGTSVSESVRSRGSLGANTHNLKVGRNVNYISTSNTVSTVNRVFDGIYGLGTSYSGSSSNPQRFKVIVESGSYNYLLCGEADGVGSTGSNFYLNATFVYGSDYDRANNDDSKLLVGFNALSTIKDDFVSTSSTKYLPSSTMIIKSGRYGKDTDNNYYSDNTRGIYVGGRSVDHDANALRVLKVEGGDINVINGGPCVETNLDSNSTATYMTGGTVRQIYGGAGTSTTYGNRIVSVSGGNVTYSIFGGSNAYDSGTEGLLTGDTLVYVGGNAVIGDDNLVEEGTKLFNVTSGNVFGAGNGADGGTTAGIVTNSHVIINGGEIKNSVYAGGNHGSVGTNTSTSTTAKIDLLGGRIRNSVFGAGESVGGGKNITQDEGDSYLEREYYTNVQSVSTVITETTVEKVKDSTGETTSGPTTTTNTTNGVVPANVWLSDGTLNNSQYICGEDSIGAVVTGPTTTSSSSRSNEGSFFRPSYYTTTTTVTTTTITCQYASSIASEGDEYNSSQSYYESVDNNFVSVIPELETIRSETNDYIHNVYITLNGSIVDDSIYGGSNALGNLYGNVDISLIKGSSVGVYGGGKGISGTSSAVQVLGKTYVHSETDNDSSLILTDVYGGSALGEVNKYGNTYIKIDGGQITNVYGGGKGDDETDPRSYGTIKVEILDGEITNVFGGNNLAGIPDEKVEVYIKGDTVANSYGGGNSSSVRKTNIYLEEGGYSGNIYGGSNTSGTVDESHVYLNGGTANNVYGGNNQGGTTTSANIIATGGEFQNIYGGGKIATSETTNIDLNGSISTYVYGGGENAPVTNQTNISLNSGTYTSVYGGSNISGLVDNTYIECNGATVTNVYGGGKNAETNTTNVTINNTFTNENVYGGGESANINQSANIRNNGGTVTNIYGGSNTTGDVTETNIYYNDGISTNVYGGNNQGGLVTTSNINILDGEITNVYGGGNSAGVTTTNVDITKGNITNVYGGANTSGTVENSYINANKYNPKLDIDINSENINPSIHNNDYATVNDVTVTVTNNLDIDIDNWELELDLPSNSVLYTNNSGNTINIENNKANITSLSGLNDGNSYTFTFSVYSTVSADNFIVTADDITDYSDIELPDYIDINKLYGGNNQGGITKTTHIDLNNGKYNEIYGGGNVATTNTTNVDVDSIKVNSIYGGGNMAVVNNNTSLKVNDSVVTNNIYGGGNAAAVNGNATTTVTGNVEVGNNIFAGGNSGAIGTSTANNSISKVVITGAKVEGHVYGGCNTSVVYGQTLVNIGYNEDNDSSLNKGDINITGTVFGGGEANASGSEIFDYNFISVTKAININIDGLDYIDDGYEFYLNGSIFGSGNASRSEGTSNIYIAHLGTLDNPSGNISIQRTDEVIIDNSVLELSGTTDRTNEYSNIKYSLNRIDKLILKNNSSLLLKENANLLKAFKSCVDDGGEEVLATVTIDDDGTVTKNVDNRVYLEAGTILNVTTNESADAYGKVEGMSFLGMYNRYGTDDIQYSYGMYDPSFENGSAADAGDIITGGSYVIGLHSTNHDITKDGFYTNYIDEEYTEISTEYINPTPEDNTFYMWTIGAASINYSIELTASKYSSLGTGSLSLIDFADGDTEFNVVGFNSDGLSSGISLVDSNSVPRFASTEDDANSIFGISMKTETTEWTGYGVTKLLSSDHGTTSGTRTYKTDSVPASPTLMFYMYHAKNITETQDLGEVTLTLQAKTPKEDNEIEYDVKLITIKILLSSRIFDDEDAYDASITYGKKYDIPSATDVKITNRSQFTAYYSLYATDINNFYGINNDYHRALVSNFILPVGTTITMLDLASNDDNPNYYYYEVTQDEYNRAAEEAASNNGEVSYNLSNFIKMDSVTSTNTYNDVAENSNYLRTGGTSAYEEFIFIFDFKNTDITGEYLNKTMLLTLRNDENRELISVLGIRQNLMKYSLYDETNAVLEQTTTLDNNYVNYDVDKNISLITNVQYDETDNRVKIIDTNYESNSMGINITFKDAVGTQVDSQLLSGTYFEINNVRYHSDSNGVFRIKLSDKVSNLSRNIKFNSSSTLPSGNYTMTVTLFASNDGLHNSSTLNSDVKTFNLTVINNNNVIKATVSDNKMKLVDGNTGNNQLNNNNLTFNIKYKSNLTTPNIRVIMYKRDTTDENTNTYSMVNMREYFTNTLSFPSVLGFVGSETYEYFAINNPNEDNEITYTWKDTLISGTYKFVFELYDDNYLVDEDIEYVIVEK